MTQLCLIAVIPLAFRRGVLEVPVRAFADSCWFSLYCRIPVGTSVCIAEGLRLPVMSSTYFSSSDNFSQYGRWSVVFDQTADVFDILIFM